MSEYQQRFTVIHKSAHEVKTIMGVESRMAILNGTMSLAILFAMESLYVLPFAVITHSLLRWLTKKDPQTIPIYTRYRIFGDVYDPWPRRSQKTNPRPYGFSRGMLC
jgi:type IV secretion system protein VirB3